MNKTHFIEKFVDVERDIVSIYSNFDQENTQIDEIEERSNKRQKKWLLVGRLPKVGMKT